MDDARTNDVTGLLMECADTKSPPIDELFHCLYDDLRKIAAGHMRRERATHTLQPTALVNEVWLKVASCDRLPTWESRKHFFGWASRAMANYLCDHGRRKKCQKSGGEYKRISLEVCEPEQGVDLALHMVELRDAVEELAKHDETRATILRLTMFTELSHAEIALGMELPVAEVVRSLKASRLWLDAYLKG